MEDFRSVISCRSGNTLPFIARYRKEVTGSLDETQLRSVAANLVSLDSLEEQRSSVLDKLQKLVCVTGCAWGNRMACCAAGSASLDSKLAAS